MAIVVKNEVRVMLTIGLSVFAICAAFAFAKATATPPIPCKYQNSEIVHTLLTGAPVMIYSDNYCNVTSYNSYLVRMPNGSLETFKEFELTK